MDENLYFYRAIAQSQNKNRWLLTIDLGLDSWVQDFPVLLMLPSSFSVSAGQKLLIRTDKYKDERFSIYIANVATSPEEQVIFTESLFHYNCFIKRISDGDSGYLNVDLGLKNWRNKIPFRLARINAYEKSGEEKILGFRAESFLKELTENKPLRIKTIKDKTEKWRRYLVEMWFFNASTGWVNVNDLMVAQGHAVYKEY